MRRTRSSILRATVETLAREGMHGARVEEIAATAGVSPGLLNYHFGNRQGLLRAGLIAGLQRRALPEDHEKADALTILSGAMVPEPHRPPTRNRPNDPVSNAWWRLRSEALRMAVFDEEVRVAIAEASEAWAGYIAARLPGEALPAEKLERAWTLIVLADGLRQRVASGLMAVRDADAGLADAVRRIGGSEGDER